MINVINLYPSTSAAHPSNDEKRLDRAGGVPGKGRDNEEVMSL